MTRARQVANFDPALFAADEVSGDKVSGGTIGAGVIGASVTGGAGLSGMTSLGTVTTGTYNATIGSSATFPAGMVRQVKTVDLGVLAQDDTDAYLPNSASFDSAILSSSDVFLQATGTVVNRDGHNDTHVHMWFSSADGGSLGEGASGHKCSHALMAYSGSIHLRQQWAGNMMVTNPNTTTPTYKVYCDRVSGRDVECEGAQIMTLMEILR